MLRIYSINRTHSQDGKELLCSTDEQWVAQIKRHLSIREPLYVTPHRDTYIFRHFVEQTLDENGYIIPGDYETETPELGKVMYSISNEHNDYYKALFPKNEPKLSFWQRTKSFINWLFGELHWENSVIKKLEKKQ